MISINIIREMNSPVLNKNCKAYEKILIKCNILA